MVSTGIPGDGPVWAAAAIHNPAAPEDIERASVTLAVSPLYPVLSAPFEDPEGEGSRRYDSEPIAAPLPCRPPCASPTRFPWGPPCGC